MRDAAQARWMRNVQGSASQLLRARPASRDPALHLEPKGQLARKSWFKQYELAVLIAQAYEKLITGIPPSKLKLTPYVPPFPSLSPLSPPPCAVHVQEPPVAFHACLEQARHVVTCGHASQRIDYRGIGE